MAFGTPKLFVCYGVLVSELDHYVQRFRPPTGKMSRSKFRNKEKFV